MDSRVSQKMRLRCLATVAKVGTVFGEYRFEGRAVATPGVSALLRRWARVRRSMVRALHSLKVTDAAAVSFRIWSGEEWRTVKVRRYRGGMVAGLARGANYLGDCWREIDVTSGWPTLPAFAIRRGTGELLDRQGRLSLMPAS